MQLAAAEMDIFHIPAKQTLRECVSQEQETVYFYLGLALMRLSLFTVWFIISAQWAVHRLFQNMKTNNIILLAECFRNTTEAAASRRVTVTALRSEPFFGILLSFFLCLPSGMRSLGFNNCLTFYTKTWSTKTNLSQKLVWGVESHKRAMQHICAYLG